MKPARTRLTKSSRSRLIVRLNGVVAGQVYESGNGSLVFRYEDAWLAEPMSYPLSLSMPLATPEHGSKAVNAYLWGLLPDDPNVIARWARRYRVSRFKVVDLLAHVGDDCAGAVQFEPSESASKFKTITSPIDVTWISEAEIGQRLRELRRDPAAGRAASDTGRFSLAGAQPKTALYYANGRWGVPGAGTPTNRILKPPAINLDDFANNEHFCLSLARELGFPTAISHVRTFGDEIAIVIERYDRVWVDGTLMRLHQEDMCQALAINPQKKYEDEGGPGVGTIVALLRRHSSSPDVDILRFIEAMAFNWYIGATDGHAKNYSLLHASGPQTRLAQLYDIISALPYPKIPKTLSMAIAGEHDVVTITGRHWKSLADALDIPADIVLDRVSELAERIPDAIAQLQVNQTGDEHVRVTQSRIGAQVVEHSRRCARRL